MKYKLGIFVILVGSLMFNSCRIQTESKEKTPTETGPLGNINVPDDFDFSTSKKASITINNTSSVSSAKYSFFLYDESFIKKVPYNDVTSGDVIEVEGLRHEFINHTIGSIVSSEQKINVDFIVPTYINSLYVLKNQSGIYSSEIIELNNSLGKTLSGSATFLTQNDVTDLLYLVNCSGEVTVVNPLTGVQTLITIMPYEDGSCAIAVDTDNKLLYTISGNYPYYTYKYDLKSSVWTRLGKAAPGVRLEFIKGTEGFNEESNDMLYHSSASNLYKVSPVTGNVVKTFNTITNLDSNSGGDLAYDDVNKQLYIVTSTGLYSLTINGSDVVAGRISGTSPPMTYNSLTFDSNNLLWTNGTYVDGSRMGIMSPGDGVAALEHEILEGHKVPMDYIVHDLGTLRFDPADVPEIDTDGDGTFDFYDDAPTDPDIATISYSPSLLGYGTYAFEDLWPSKGDYDFNDLVVNYRLKTMKNTDGLVKKFEWEFFVKHIGGSYHNGFGLAFDFDKSLVESVNGAKYTETGLILVDANGLESDQDKAVAIVFDDGHKQSEQKIIFSLIFKDPVTTEVAGNIPFNPFIFINGDRPREVHLTNYAPTSKASDKFFNIGDDSTDPSKEQYYKSKSNLPWALHIIHDFIPLVEKTSILEGYNFFKDWASSGGKSYKDWYTDKSGNRNGSKLRK